MVSTNQWQSESTKNPIRFDLQHFADGAPDAAPVPASDAPSYASFAEAGDAWVRAQSGEAEPVETGVPDPTPAAPVQEGSKDVLELLKQRGTTKFTDPEKFVDSHLALEKWATKVSQEKAALAKQVAELKAQMQQAPAVQQHVTPAEPIDADTFLAKMYEDPNAALEPFKAQWMQEVRQELLKELQPTIQTAATLSAAEREAATRTAQATAAQQFFAVNPDAEQYIDQMTDILLADSSFTQLTNPEEIQDLMNKTLTYVRGMSYTPPPTTEALVEKLLGDDAMFNKFIASNPAVRNKLLSSAVRDVRNTKVPPMVTGMGGAQMTTIPVDQPSSFEALGERIKRSMGFS